MIIRLNGGAMYAVDPLTEGFISYVSAIKNSTFTFNSANDKGGSMYLNQVIL
jgi:hypothetical protein